MVYNSVLYDFAKTSCLGKICFSSYGLQTNLRLLLLVRCGQLCLSSSQVLGFFDHHNVSGGNQLMCSFDQSLKGVYLVITYWNYYFDNSSQTDGTHILEREVSK